MPTYSKSLYFQNSFNEIQCNKQFIDGISSLCNDLTSTTFYSNKYLLVSKNITTFFDEMVKQFSYTQLQVLEIGSNEYSKAQDAIPEFELLLSE